MTLDEMKQKVYSLIEEYVEDADDLTEDPDLAIKMNSVINQIQNELARFKKIPAFTTITKQQGSVIDLTELDSFYQLDHVSGCKTDIFGTRVEFLEDGTLKIYYYKYPKQITEETDDDYKFELTTDALEVAVVGIAGTLFMSDVSNNYGSVYMQRYERMKQELDPRYNLGQIYIDGGIEI